MYILAQFATERPGRLRAMSARTRQFYYVDTRQRFWTATVSARHYGLSASTIHNRLRKKTNTISSVRAALKRSNNDDTSQARRHFIWQCVDWNRVSFSGVTRFALSNADGKTHKQALLGLLRAGKGSIWWGRFVVWGGKMGDQKTYFVVMQDNFNAFYRRRLVTSCHTISPLFLHIKN